ncbi:unnamed protein product, partial [Mesorhabditis belari]|uniref:Uncharacterized protein n=1 Tax=Mesorhabditis belari TaxID=2138241 RepID=A0AAF3EEL4_9BILA
MRSRRSLCHQQLYSQIQRYFLSKVTITTSTSTTSLFSSTTPTILTDFPAPTITTSPKSEITTFVVGMIGIIPAAFLSSYYQVPHERLSPDLPPTRPSSPPLRRISTSAQRKPR